MRQPEPLPAYEGLYYVQAFGKSCPQQRLVLPNGLDSKLVADIGSVVSVLYDNLTPADEDCKGAFVLLVIRELSYPPGLTINVFKPSDATPTSNLPVVFVRTFLLAKCHGAYLDHHTVPVDFWWRLRNWWSLYVCLILSGLFRWSLRPISAVMTVAILSRGLLTLANRSFSLV